jgi:hypothetical protein
LQHRASSRAHEQDFMLQAARPLWWTANSRLNPDFGFTSSWRQFYRTAGVQCSVFTQSQCVEWRQFYRTAGVQCSVFTQSQCVEWRQFYRTAGVQCSVFTQISVWNEDSSTGLQEDSVVSSHRVSVWNEDSSTGLQEYSVVSSHRSVCGMKTVLPDCRSTVQCLHAGSVRGMKAVLLSVCHCR